MRILVATVVVAMLGAPARADDNDKALKAFAGQIVMSPDAPPSRFDDLPKYLKSNVTKDGHYELIKWEVNFVGVLAKPTDKVTLVVGDPAAKQDKDLISIELPVKRLVVIGHFAPTKAASFAAGKPYEVTLVAGKVVVAKAVLVLHQG
jgi:hypothetical protein